MKRAIRLGVRFFCAVGAEPAAPSASQMLGSQLSKLQSFVDLTVDSMPQDRRRFFEEGAELIDSFTPQEKEYLLYLIFSHSPEHALRGGKLRPLGENPFDFTMNPISGLSSGSAKASAASPPPSAEVPEEKAEPVAQKKNVDIELVGIDAAKKLTIIKEVKALLNLGLKEAKDLVDKGNAVLKTGVPIEEAEAIKEKLVAIGCSINFK